MVPFRVVNRQKICNKRVSFQFEKVAGENLKVGRARLGHVRCSNLHLGNQRVQKRVVPPAREEGADGCWFGKILKSGSLFEVLSVHLFRQKDYLAETKCVITTLLL